MLARRDTRREAARLRRLSPLQTLENQSQIWGIRCHSCTGREGLPPSWKLSYKTYVLRFTRESRFSFDQRIARILICYLDGLLVQADRHSWLATATQLVLFASQWCPSYSYVLPSP